MTYIKKRANNSDRRYTAKHLVKLAGERFADEFARSVRRMLSKPALLEIIQNELAARLKGLDLDAEIKDRQELIEDIDKLYATRAKLRDELIETRREAFNSIRISSTVAALVDPPDPCGPLEVEFITAHVPKTGGVYFLWSKEGHIGYVGLAKRLQDRLKSHTSTVHGRGQSEDRFSFLEIQCEHDRAAFEAIYIGLFRPPRNGEFRNLETAHIPFTRGLLSFNCDAIRARVRKLDHLMQESYELVEETRP